MSRQIPGARPRPILQSDNVIELDSTTTGVLDDLGVTAPDPATLNGLLQRVMVLTTYLGDPDSGTPPLPSDLSSTVSGLSDQITQINQNLDTDEATLAAVSNKASTNESNISGLSSTISANTTDIGTNQASISTNATDISTLQSDLAALAARVTALEGGGSA